MCPILPKATSQRQSKACQSIQNAFINQYCICIQCIRPVFVMKHWAECYFFLFQIAERCASNSEGGLPCIWTDESPNL